MNTIKTLSIVGIVLSAFGIITFYTSDFTEYVSEAEAVAGWLIMNSIWLFAQSVTSIVQIKKNSE